MNKNVVQKQWADINKRMKVTDDPRERAILKAQLAKLKPALQAEYASAITTPVVKIKESRNQPQKESDVVGSAPLLRTPD